MALKPHWSQPSHGDIQEVIFGSETDFTTKSISKVALPPFALFAKFDFPPCTLADEPTYATVQIGRNQHMNLNSDLLYINHSCEPSLFFDTGNFNVIVGPKGLKPGDELTFFYPSTEFDMAQPFDCLCGTPSCRGTIAGAKNMTKAQLEGAWLNGHIRELLSEREEAPQEQQYRHHHAAKQNGKHAPNGTAGQDPTAQALRDALGHAEKAVLAAKMALRSYTRCSAHPAKSASPNGAENAGAGAVATKKTNGHHRNGNGHGVGASTEEFGDADAAAAVVSGSERRGPTSRELAGEMGGDTVNA